jgi:CheY-like chemotaxis protein
VGSALIVDDDETVLLALTRLLRSAGTHAFTATSAEDAVATLEAHAAEIGLIVSDYSMPGTNGAELHAAARAVNMSHLFKLFTKPWQPGEVQAALADALLSHRALAVELQHALDRDELTLHYQPLQGRLAPGLFIPVAEECGRIEPLGQWVVAQACRQAASWQADGTPIGISVNVSAQHLDSPGLADGVATCLRESGLPPAMLTLELTRAYLPVTPDQSG